MLVRIRIIHFKFAGEGYTLPNRWWHFYYGTKKNVSSGCEGGFQQKIHILTKA